MARPTSFTPEIAAKICERLAQGKSLRQICLAEDMPARSTIHAWLDRNPEFRDQYACARDLALDDMAEETLDIADDGHNDTYTDGDGNERTDIDVIQRSKLRVDTRKWYLSKLAPKRYGERSAVELSGPNGGPVQVEDLSAAERTAQLLALAQSRRDRDASDLV